MSGTIRCGSFSYRHAVNHAVTMAGSSSSKRSICRMRVVLPVPHDPKMPTANSGVLFLMMSPSADA